MRRVVTMIAGLAGFYAAAADAQSSPSAFTSGTRYDLQHRVLGTIAPDPDGAGPLHYAAVRNTYDAAGRLVRVETGELSAWQPETVAPANWSGLTVYHQLDTVYDGLDRKLTDTVSSGGTSYALTQYSYDPVGRLQCTAVRMNPGAWGSLPADACTQGAAGSYGPDRITKNIYDDAGQLVQVRKAVGTTSPNLEQAYATYSYTQDGKQQDVVDANGNHAKVVYDGYDRKTQWQFPSMTPASSFDGSTPSNALSSANAVDSGDYEAYDYDSNGNRTSWRRRDGQTFTLAYDGLNRLASQVLTSTSCTSNCTAPVRGVYYGYDAWGRQLYARFDSTSGGDGVTNGYDGFGELTSTTTSLGSFSSTLSFQYDLDGNRVRVAHPDGTWFGYNYDGLDRLASIAENGGATIATETYDAQAHPVAETRGAVSSAYGYDGLERLASLSDDLAGTANDVTRTFGYSPASQMVSRATSNDTYAWSGAVAVNRGYAVNGLNQYSSAGPATFGYDANGNLTSDGTTGYGYDAENRLISTTAGVGLTYDPSGRLLQSAGPSGTTYYVYDGDQLTAEYDGSGNLLRRYVHGAGEDNPLIWYEGAGLNDRRSLQVDHQGSVVSIADSSGNATAINAYDEYGIPNSTNAGRFQYTGQAWLPDLGMYYYKARIYSPTLGRFLQTDPIGYKDQMDLYSYVANDPVNAVDPKGMCATGSIIASSECGPGYEIDGGAPDAKSSTLGKAAARAAAVDVIGGGPEEPIGDIAAAIVFIYSITESSPNVLASKPPKDAHDPDGAKAPGKPGEAEGFKDPKTGEKWVSTSGGKKGFLDDKGNIWVPTGKGSTAHGGPHWDVQGARGGSRGNVYPGGRTRPH